MTENDIMSGGGGGGGGGTGRPGQPGPPGPIGPKGQKGDAMMIGGDSGGSNPGHNNNGVPVGILPNV